MYYFQHFLAICFMNNIMCFKFYFLWLNTAVQIIFFLNFLLLLSGDGTLSVCNLRRNKVSCISVFSGSFWNINTISAFNFTHLFPGSLTGPSPIWVLWRWAIVCCFNEGMMVIVLCVWFCCEFLSFFSNVSKNCYYDKELLWNSIHKMFLCFVLASW